MKRIIGNLFCLIITMLSMTSCSYNPFSDTNHTTGNVGAGAVGAVGGVAVASMLTSSKAVVVSAGIAGGMLGYYVSTLRYDAAGVIRGGGDVYKMGEYVAIYIPTDNLFEVNSDEFLPDADAIIASAADVLKRYPNNNIMISGNTSGFDSYKREQALSERRAQKVAAGLWNEGINNFKREGTDERKLSYTGFGDYFPIANRITNNGLRTNSRIQITSYPSDVSLQIDKRSRVFNNVGAWDDNHGKLYPKASCGGRNPCFAPEESE